MNHIFRLYLCGLLFVFVAACASTAVRFKDESELDLERIRASGVEALFPFEARDVYKTVEMGNLELARGETQAADAYYSLAIGKVEILEARYVKELKRRDDAARAESELKSQAEVEIELQKKRLEKSEALAREAARVKRIEAEKAESRRKAEKSRQEKEQPSVTRHTVKRGETLPQIAAQLEIYGDSSLWPLIYKANRDQISNPGVLWPGQVLRIPRSPDKNDISEARRFSSERALR